MAYEIRLSKNARKSYLRADSALTKKLDRCFKVLEQTPRQHPNIKALKGELTANIATAQATIASSTALMIALLK